MGAFALDGPLYETAATRMRTDTAVFDGPSPPGGCLPHGPVETGGILLSRQEAVEQYAANLRRGEATIINACERYVLDIPDTGGASPPRSC